MVIEKVKITLRIGEPVMLVKLYAYGSTTNKIVVRFKFCKLEAGEYEAHTQAVIGDKEIESGEINSMALTLQEYFPQLITHFEKRGLL